MYKKILIPLDHSPTDQIILKHIRPLIKLTEGSLLLVHIAEGYAARLQNQLNLEDSEEIHVDEKYLKKLRDELTKEGFRADYLLGKGEPADEILNIAEKEHCDLIAMATHGHRFLKDLLFGSVAENIRHRTSIPILMIRAPKK